MSQTDILINELAKADGRWVSITELVAAGCGYAIATRASNARAQGIAIENRMERDEKTGARHSWYRIAPQQLGLEGVG